ncbi:hypothetical protein D1007_10088 [Hordeum vulgare]|nr:hypothetical protein D1007_10088 [Hordeum vulgare]
MIFLDHENSYNGGGGSTWDDVLATPLVYLPHVISPKKKIMDDVSGEEQSRIDGSYVDDNTMCEANKFASNEEVVRLRPRPKRGNVDEEGCDDDDDDDDDDSEDSDYVPEIVDSDYELEDGDGELVQDQLHSVSNRKGKQVVEDCNSEDEKLEAP